MSQTDDLLARARAWEASFPDTGMPAVPATGIAIVACMDARLDPVRIFGLADGDAHVIRNARGVVTDDVIRSPAVSQRLLGTEEIILLHHSDCGMQTFTDDEFRAVIARDAGEPPPWRSEALADVYEDVRASLRRIADSPFLPRRESVRGFVHDDRTGRLIEVLPAGGGVPVGRSEQAER